MYVIENQFEVAKKSYPVYLGELLIFTILFIN